MMSSPKSSPMEIYRPYSFALKKRLLQISSPDRAGPKEQEAYVKALFGEINAVTEGTGRSVSSIFIGGGTPSVLDENFIGDILKTIRTKFSIQADARDHHRSKSRNRR